MNDNTPELISGESTSVQGKFHKFLHVKGFLPAWCVDKDITPDHFSLQVFKLVIELLNSVYMESQDSGYILVYKSNYQAQDIR